uniref:Reverse transcriptase domain-containing protein n=1 Tax=Tanacetum cinerariifolium TaxID=118510 RepID=A0A699KSW6_TANCI|nr:hypothetical protein [Tanacetum cinerariifolium]
MKIRRKAGSDSSIFKNKFTLKLNLSRIQVQGSFLPIDQSQFQVKCKCHKPRGQMCNSAKDISKDYFCQEEIDVVAITNDVFPPSVENEDSDKEVDAGDVLRADNFIQNSEHEYSESEDSGFDNPPIPLPPPESPDKEFDFEIAFEKEILFVRSAIVKFEYIDAKVKFDVFNDENYGLSYFMFNKMFSLLFVESEDTIFDPGISD